MIRYSGAPPFFLLAAATSSLAVYAVEVYFTLLFLAAGCTVTSNILMRLSQKRAVTFALPFLSPSSLPPSSTVTTDSLSHSKLMMFASSPLVRGSTRLSPQASVAVLRLRTEAPVISSSLSAGVGFSGEGDRLTADSEGWVKLCCSAVPVMPQTAQQTARATQSKIAAGFFIWIPRFTEILIKRNK